MLGYGSEVSDGQVQAELVSWVNYYVEVVAIDGGYQAKLGDEVAYGETMELAVRALMESEDLEVPDQYIYPEDDSAWF